MSETLTMTVPQARAALGNTSGLSAGQIEKAQRVTDSSTPRGHAIKAASRANAWFGANTAPATMRCGRAIAVTAAPS